jgi:hypothetical protein
MTNLKTYVICEELDVDNLLYKIDKWFDRRDNEKATFSELIQQFKKENVVSQSAIDSFIDTNKIQLKQFVDYMSDNINNTQTLDYAYVFRKIIDTLVANKSI